MKDLSAWSGNLDLPIKDYPSLASLLTAGADNLEYDLLQKDQSNVAIVRLESKEEIARLTQFMNDAAWDANNPQRLIGLLTEGMAEGDFVQAAGDLGVVIPALSARPSDLAGYIRRYNRLACDRQGKPNCLEMTNELLFALLSYGWPGNCQEVQEVLTAVVEASEDARLGLEQFERLQQFELPRPLERVGRFMKLFQIGALERELGRLDGDLSRLGRDLELDPSPISATELAELPLLDNNLGAL